MAMVRLKGATPANGLVLRSSSLMPGWGTRTL